VFERNQRRKTCFLDYQTIETKDAILKHYKNQSIHFACIECLVCVYSMLDSDSLLPIFLIKWRRRKSDLQRIVGATKELYLGKVELMKILRIFVNLAQDLQVVHSRHFQQLHQRFVTATVWQPSDVHSQQPGVNSQNLPTNRQQSPLQYRFHPFRIFIGALVVTVTMLMRLINCYYYYYYYYYY